MLRSSAIVAIVLAAVLGCARATPIPAGAHEVHITILESEVRLDPRAVPAGDVYLVLDAPPDGSFAFVQHKGAADAEPGPLSDDDLARLARGDTEFTAVGGLDAGGCSEDQDREDRGMMGPCGNVMPIVLTPGRYAIVAGAPEGDPATGRMPPMAILEVLP